MICTEHRKRGFSIHGALFLLLAVILSLYLLPTGTVHAQEKEETIITLHEKQDLMVLFTFDRESVPIHLISPSGKRIGEGDEGVKVSKGDRYLTILVTDAEPGNWKAAYDLGSNTKIEYSVMNETASIWIEDFQVAKTQEGADFKFTLGDESGDLWISYEIYAVDTVLLNDDVLIDDGSARSGDEVDREISLSRLSSGTYRFRLDIYYNDGNGEIFDSGLSEPIEWQNDQEQGAPDGVTMSVDLLNDTLLVDWSQAGLFGDNCRITVLADDELIAQDETEIHSDSHEIVFPAEAKQLEVQFSARERGVWSPASVRTIDLNECWLRMTNADVCTDGLVTFSYHVPGDRTLSLSISDDTDTTQGEYRISGEGTISFPITRGNNLVSASVPVDDSLYFCLNTEVYYDAIPPGIRLYDNPDGRTVSEDHISLIGSVSGADRLMINDKEILLDENGGFVAKVPLFSGENTITLNAMDPGGNETGMLISVTCTAGPSGDGGGGSDSSKQTISGDQVPAFARFLPLIASALTSLLLIVIGFVFIKKTEKKKRSFSMVALIIWDIILLPAEGVLIYYYLRLRAENYSPEFITLAERSARDASTALSREKMFLILVIIGAVISILSILVTILAGRFINRRKKTEAPE